MKQMILAAVLASAVIASVTIGTVAIAQSGGDAFFACAKSNGEVKSSTIRQNSTPTCATGETVVSWNAEGPEGPPGPQGDPGPGTTRITSIETDPTAGDNFAIVTSDPCPEGSKVVSGFATPHPVVNFALYISSIHPVTLFEGEALFVAFASDNEIAAGQQFQISVECEETA